MAEIRNIEFDLENRRLVISAKSTGKQYVTIGKYIYSRFENIHVDTSCTITGCTNSPSTNAIKRGLTDIDVTSRIDESTGNIVEADAITEPEGVKHYNGDLIEYVINFDDTDILDFLSQDIENELLLVWIEEGVYSYTQGSTPILIDTKTELHQLCFSKSTLYQLLLNHIKIKSGKCCKSSCSDVNFMLAWHGFNLASSLKIYRKALYYWQLLHNVVAESKNCGCNG